MRKRGLNPQQGTILQYLPKMYTLKDDVENGLNDYGKRNVENDWVEELDLMVEHNVSLERKKLKVDMEISMGGAKSTTRKMRSCTRYGKKIKFTRGRAANELTNYFNYVDKNSLGSS